MKISTLLYKLADKLYEKRKKFEMLEEWNSGASEFLPNYERIYDLAEELAKKGK